jgi:hypothetical protein
MRTYLTGGRQRSSTFVRRDEWTSFEAALLLELDTDTGALRRVLEYVSPPGTCPDKDPSVLFKSGSWDGDHLLLCTQTEVLRVDPVAGEVVQRIDHPWFNDLHHVARIDGRIHVVCTGLDALFVLDEGDRQIAEVHGALGQDPFEGRFDRDIDYRRVHTTKPHQSHPNFVSQAAGTRWLARFEQGDALALDREVGPIAVSSDRIHDGLAVGDELWFTVVSGEVVQASARTGQVLGRWDLKGFPRAGDEPLGWCRGLHVLEDRVLVGFSRLRPTRFVQNLSWLRGALKRPEPEPCRVVAYDLERGEQLESWNLEGAGMSAVFSILPA